MARRRVLNESALLALQVIPPASARPPGARDRARLTIELEDGRTIAADLPSTAARAAERAAHTGEELAFMELGEELSSTEAGTLLGMSRPTMSKLLDEGVIPSRREGRDRRVHVADVLAFKDRRERMQRAQVDLAAMAERNQEFFAGDGEDDDYDPSIMEPAQ